MGFCLFQIIHAHGKLHHELHASSGRRLRKSFFKKNQIPLPLRAVAVKSTVILSIKPANLLCRSFSVVSITANGRFVFGAGFCDSFFIVVAG